MNTSSPKAPSRLWLWLRPWIEGILPRADRERLLTVMDDAQGKSPLRHTIESLAMVGLAYRQGYGTRFNKKVRIAEVALVSYCLLAVGPSSFPPVLLVVGVLLAVLSFRDVWLPWAMGEDRDIPAESLYYIDSTIDALAAGTAVVFAEVMAQLVSTGLAMPAGNLFRFSVVCFPLLSMFRVTMRPKPGPGAPKEWKGMSVEYAFWWTWRLNVLWMFVYAMTLTANSSDIPGYLPDKLRGALAGSSLGLWIVVGRHTIYRWDAVQRLFEHWRKTRLRQWLELLAQRIPRGQPGYWKRKIVEAILFVGLAMSSADAVWRWLAGHANDWGVFLVATNLIGVITNVLTWRYVVAANEAAADALKAEIERLDREDKEFALAVRV
jgi:hypothetical protein